MQSPGHFVMLALFAPVLLCLTCGGSSEVIRTGKYNIQTNSWVSGCGGGGPLSVVVDIENNSGSWTLTDQSSNILGCTESGGRLNCGGCGGTCTSESWDIKPSGTSSFSASTSTTSGNNVVGCGTCSGQGSCTTTWTVTGTHQ
jgi:hypothetical protein